MDLCLTLKRAKLGPVLTLQYMYIYIYIQMLWCYYLGQVWPFEVLLSGPSLFFYRTLFVKNTIEIGVSALFLKKMRALI